MRKSFFKIILFCFVIFSSTAFASALPLTGADLDVEMHPEYPGTHQNVEVKVTSYITDTDSAKISWILNGVVKSTGKGIKTFTFQTGDSGTITRLDIVVENKDGTIKRNITLQPLDVDLVWQSESYVPPFYKGKAMLGHENTITFIAIPHITTGSGEVDPKNLVYKWSKNGTGVEDASGYGKNTFTFVTSLISRPLNIGVNVSSPSSNISGYAVVDVAPQDPSLLVYRKNPIYGIEFQKALSSSVELNDSKEITLVGIPYFFGVKKTNSLDLKYNWEINGAKIDGKLTNVQVLRQKEGTSGSSNISLSIENSRKILQAANQSFSLKFGNTNTSNSLF